MIHFQSAWNSSCSLVPNLGRREDLQLLRSKNQTLPDVTRYHFSGVSQIFVSYSAPFLSCDIVRWFHFWTFPPLEGPLVSITCLHHSTPPIEGHTWSHILRSIFIPKKDFPLGRTPWYHLISIRPFSMPHYVSHLFSTLISVDKSHIVSWRSYPLSMHGQELRGDTHLLVMLWYQSGSMDSTQGYSLASWLDFQCLCWTSWWLSLPTPWSSPACQSLAWHCEIMGFSVQAATSIVDVGKCKGHWVGQGDVGLHCVCSELRVAWFHDKFWCWVSFSMVILN